MKYHNIEKRINGLQVEIAAKEKQLSQAKDRTDRAAAEIEGLFEAFKKQMLAGKETKIAEVENAIDNARKEMNRDKALVAALEEAIPKLQEELADLVEKKNSIFSRLALAWTREEIEVYDKAARATVKAAQRLFIVFAAMKEMGHPEEFKEVVGSAFDYLSALKIPEIKSFDARQFAERHHPGLRASQKDVEATLHEVIKG